MTRVAEAAPAFLLILLGVVGLLATFTCLVGVVLCWPARDADEQYDRAVRSELSDLEDLFAAPAYERERSRR